MRASACGSALVAVLLSILIVTYPVFDCDLYWHLANGREMLGRRQIVNEELFSFTRAQAPFVNHEWLSQILMHGTWERFGAHGLMVFKWTLSASTIALLFRTIRSVGASGSAGALICALAALAGLR